MSNKSFVFAVVSIAVLAVMILDTSDIKMPGSGMSSSIIDAITDFTSIDSVPVEPTPAEAESTQTVEPVPPTPPGISNFTEALQTVTDSVKNFVEPVLVGSVLAPIPAAPKGVSNFKIFIGSQETLESKVNDWFAVQQGIVVDGLNVGDYGGGAYLVIINYHMGGTGNSSTRLKLIAGENSEADAQTFLSSLGASRTVRSVAAIAGSYSGPQTTVTVPIIFIVYE